MIFLCSLIIHIMFILSFKYLSEIESVIEFLQIHRLE